MGKHTNKQKFWLKIHGKELWISPAGSDGEFFLTDKKITMKEIKNFKIQNNQLKL